MSVEQDITAARSTLEHARAGLLDALRSERGRRRGPMMRDLHRIDQMLGQQVYFSQAGQDRVIDARIGAKTGGVFADIGGYDGVTGSNTLFFEVFRGWSGVLVEPAPTQFRKARALRRCQCLPYAVSGTGGQLDFMEVTAGFTQMSGFLDGYDPGMLAQVRADPRHAEVIHTLEAKPLGEILAEAGMGQVDFLSLDVEGAELDILETFDFKAFDVTFLSVENNAQSADLPKLMADRGYDLIEFAGVDDIFCKR